MIGDFIIRVLVGLALLPLATWGLMVLAPVLDLPNLSFDQSWGIVILGWLVYSVFRGYDKGFQD